MRKQKFFEKIMVSCLNQGWRYGNNDGIIFGLPMKKHRDPELDPQAPQLRQRFVGSEIENIKIIITSRRYGHSYIRVCCLSLLRIMQINWQQTIK
jgi:hypothetical protein